MRRRQTRHAIVRKAASFLPAAAYAILHRGEMQDGWPMAEPDLTLSLIGKTVLETRDAVRQVGRAAEASSSACRTIRR